MQDVQNGNKKVVKVFRGIGYAVGVLLIVCLILAHYNYSNLAIQEYGKNGVGYSQQHLYTTILFIGVICFLMWLMKFTATKKQ